jgi:hypothetical protein
MVDSMNTLEIGKTYTTITGAPVRVVRHGLFGRWLVECLGFREWLSVASIRRMIWKME